MRLSLSSFHVWGNEGSKRLNYWLWIERTRRGWHTTRDWGGFGDTGLLVIIPGQFWGSQKVGHRRFEPVPHWPFLWTFTKPKLVLSLRSGPRIDGAPTGSTLKNAEFISLWVREQSQRCQLWEINLDTRPTSRLLRTHWKDQSRSWLSREVKARCKSAHHHLCDSPHQKTFYNRPQVITHFTARASL